MENNYHYLDTELKYTNKNGLLNNLANIEDEKILLVFESLKVSKRIEQLIEKPIKIKDSNSLLKIHHLLFQDVYEWAGQVRIVNISKDGKPFFNKERFHIAFKYLDTLISEYRTIKKTDKAELAKKLAVLGKLYCMALLSEDEYTAVKKRIMREYNVVSFMNT